MPVGTIDVWSVCQLQRRSGTGQVGRRNVDPRARAGVDGGVLFRGQLFKFGPVVEQQVPVFMEIAGGGRILALLEYFPVNRDPVAAQVVFCVKREFSVAE